MKFTKEFKDLLKKIYEENDADCIQILLEEEEDQSLSINLGLLSTKECEGKYKTIDEVNVLVDPETEEALEDAIFSSNGDEVQIQLDHCCCEEEHHDGECCHGHHHHHDGECCEGNGENCSHHHEEK